MSSSIQSMIQQVPAPLYADDQLMSTDLSILSREQNELIPRESNTFGSQVNSAIGSQALSNRTTFNISAPRHYLDLQSSYITAQLQVVSTTTGDVAHLDSFLDNGGIHSAIKSVVLRSGSAELLRLENYNKLYNISNFATMSKEQREFMSASCLDSFEDRYQEEKFDYRPITFVSSTATYTNATRTITVASSIASELKVGDKLMIETGAVTAYTVAAASANAIGAGLNHKATVQNVVRVVSIASNGLSFVVDKVLKAQTGGTVADAAYDATDGQGNLTSGDLAVGQIKSIVRVCRSANSMRGEAVNNTKRVAFRIPFNLFAVDAYLPLPFFSNVLELQIEWEPYHNFIVIGPSVTWASTDKYGYALTDVRFVAMMVEPSASVFNAHKALYKKSGLVYRMKGIRNYENQLTTTGGTQFNLTYQANLKSVSTALCVLTDQALDNATTDTDGTVQKQQCQSNFLKGDILSWRWRAGGLNFPQYSSVDCANYALAEDWQQLQLVKDAIAFRNGSEGCISARDWHASDGSKYIIAMQFSKDKTFNTGIDCSNNYLELELVYNSAFSTNRTLHSFLMYDMAMVLSEQERVRLYY